MMSTPNSRISAAITRAKTSPNRRHPSLADLEDEKQRLLRRGISILMRADDYAAREAWFAEYNSIRERIREYDAA